MWQWFHQPDFSLPVVRRAMTAELLDIMVVMMEVLATRGRSLVWQHCFPSATAYYAARRRLEKAGLIVYRRSKGRQPYIRLTLDGQTSGPEFLRPEQWWNRRWSGIWYLLVYDVPEIQRGYRNVLRRFLRRLRMGCLQGSVWITSRDIRPDFDDLTKAAGIGAFAYLFEARTVLGLRAEQVIQAAWPVDFLGQCQAWYGDNVERQLQMLGRQRRSEKDLLRLAKEAGQAFYAVMAQDPLLPKSLWPAHYQGPRVLDLHRRLLRAIALRL